jgi:hypothetical protein
MPDITLTASLRPENEEYAVAVLQFYYSDLKYQPIDHKNVGFTGGAWDSFDPSGTRERTRYEFTSDDLVSLAFLSVPLKALTVHDLLIRRRSEFTELLMALKPYENVDFAMLDGVDRETFPEGWALETALREVPSVRPPAASMLMARKFPRLFPILDQVVVDFVFVRARSRWIALHRKLRENDFELHKRLIRIRDAAGLDAGISPLRVFDALAWMDGSGQSRFAPVPAGTVG